MSFKNNPHRFISSSNLFIDRIYITFGPSYVFKGPPYAKSKPLCFNSIPPMFLLDPLSIVFTTLSWLEHRKKNDEIEESNGSITPPGEAVYFEIYGGREDECLFWTKLQYTFVNIMSNN